MIILVLVSVVLLTSHYQQISANTIGYCDSVPKVENGYINEPVFSYIGQLVPINCFDGFMITGPIKISCTNYGTWTAPGTCVPIKFEDVRCHSEPVVDNALVTSGSAGIGSMRQFFCSVDYYLDGSNQILCDEHGHWTSFGQCKPVPVAAKKQCHPYPQVDNAVVGLGGSEAGEKRVFDCFPGFFMIGRNFVVCDASGEWRRLGICQMGCEQLFPVRNGYYLTEEGSPTTLVVKCYPGFDLDGPNSIFCDLYTGRWSIPGDCKQQKSSPPIRITLNEFLRVSAKKWAPDFQQQLVTTTTLPPTCCEAGPKVSSPALVLAARNGNMTELTRQLDLNADPNTVDTHKWTALIWAVSNRRRDAVDALLQCCANTEMRNVLNSTAIMFAAKRGDIEIAKLLLAHGANANAANTFGMTALLFAAQNGKTDMVRTLMAHRATDLAAVDSEGNTALILAVKGNHVDTVRALLESGAATLSVVINARNKSGKTALITAAKDGNVEIAALLLESGVDTRTTDADGNSAYTYASAYGHSEIATLLLDYDGDFFYQQS